MASSRIEVKRKTFRKRNRSKVKGTMRRKNVTVRNKGKGNVSVAMAKRP